MRLREQNKRTLQTEGQTNVDSAISPKKICKERPIEIPSRPDSDCPADLNHFKATESKICASPRRLDTEYNTTPTRSTQCKHIGEENCEMTTFPRRLDFQQVAKVWKSSRRGAEVVDPSSKLKLKPRRQWSSIVNTYMNKIRRGTTWICSCCGGLFYRESVRNIDKIKLRKWGLNDDMISSILHVDQDDHQAWTRKSKVYCLCITCYSYCKANKLPRLALVNGLDFPTIPDQLKVCKIYVCSSIILMFHTFHNL